MKIVVIFKTKFENLTSADITNDNSWSKKLSEGYMRQLRKEASDQVFSK